VDSINIVTSELVRLSSLFEAVEIISIQLTFSIASLLWFWRGVVLLPLLAMTRQVLRPDCRLFKKKKEKENQDIPVFPTLSFPFSISDDLIPVWGKCPTISIKQRHRAKTPRATPAPRLNQAVK